MKGREWQAGTRGGYLALALAALMGSPSAGCSQRQASAKDPNPGTVDSVSPGKVDVNPRGAKPYDQKPYASRVFTPYATPFAIKVVRAGQTSCVLKADGGRQQWSVVPFAPKLFRPGQKPPAEDAPRNPGPGFVPYCVYKWKNWPKLPTRDDFGAIEAIPDYAVIGGKPNARIEEPDPSHTGPNARNAGMKLSPEVYDPLLKVFAHQASGVEPVRWSALRKKSFSAEQPVRVALVDATPGDLSFRDTSLHGMAVGRVIGELLCGKADACNDFVRPYLALPLIKGQVEDYANGGYAGTFAHLADALMAALQDWPENERRVINLSLGWEALRVDDNDSKVDRIVKLLEKASCRGALIIAASGNRSVEEGPVYPGGLETRKAPMGQACVQFDLPADRQKLGRSKALPAPPIKVPAPLVYAAGALDNRDQRLMLDRRWAQPRVAALGVNVTVPGPAGMPYTSLLSGTSGATGIVSGIAAAVWTVRPELTGHQVMALVHIGGVALDGGAVSRRARTEFCAGKLFGTCEGEANQVRRVYLCGALAAALPSAGLRCDPSLSKAQPRWPAQPVQQKAQQCRVAACGIPEGASSYDGVAEVFPHQGFAGCPACTLRITPSGAILEGRPEKYLGIPETGLEVLVRVAAMPRQVIPFTFQADTKTFFDQAMSLTMFVPPSTVGGVVSFHYNVGGGWVNSDAYPLKLVH